MAENTITRDQIRDGAINDDKVGAGANIATAKLALNGTIIFKDGSVAFTGDQSMGNNKITSLATPSSGTDAANKDYVDNSITTALSPFTAKGTVRVATTANITLSGTQTIDGISVIANDRVLVKDQTAPAENGIYLCAAGSWSRVTDMDSWTEIPGAWVTVQVGTANADTVWLATADLGGTLNTTAVTFINPLSSIGLTSSNFVFDETPSGTINGSNASFTIANTPTSGTLRVFRNGLRVLQGSGNGYTLSGTTITMTTAPNSGDSLRVDYMK